MDRGGRLPVLGQLDHEAGEFWVENPFLMPKRGDNLSGYEHNCLFLNTSQPGNPSFLDASFASAADLDSDSRSAIAADFDRDGDLDLLVGSVGGGPLRLFENRMAQGQRLLLSLRGSSCNRSGIGCRIFPASGFMGTGPIEQNIGLGPATRITRLQVRWPDGTNQEFHDLPVDRRHQVTQGTAALRSLPLEKSTGPVSSP